MKNKPTCLVAWRNGRRGENGVVKAFEPDTLRCFTTWSTKHDEGGICRQFSLYFEVDEEVIDGQD